MLQRLAVPVSVALFGANKTWRGFAVVPLLNGVLSVGYNLTFPLVLTGVTAFVEGLLLGLVYLLSELPNSWLKRRWGIPSGERAGRYAGLFMMLDKMDSCVGVSLLAIGLMGWSWGEGILLWVVSVGVHIVISWLLVVLRVKKRF